MALTFVSKDLQAPRSRSWVGQRVHLLEPPRLYPSVCLRRADRCMAEKLLNCPQIGTTLEQMRGERVPQRVRRDAALHRRAADPSGQTATYVRGGKALS